MGSNESHEVVTNVTISGHKYRPQACYRSMIFYLPYTDLVSLFVIMSSSPKATCAVLLGNLATLLKTPAATIAQMTETIVPRYGSDSKLDIDMLAVLTGEKTIH